MSSALTAGTEGNIAAKLADALNSAKHVRQRERNRGAIGRASSGKVSSALHLFVHAQTKHFLSYRLALYVYEYLLHVGAQKSAQTFLSEIRWEKNITLGEPPGFLHSWWW
ncbi:hypothetical protein DNTS_007093 [Danionella cerebrum]|uniref:Uncharacterized protein n=1 Tax=Danionella cerebrum TaxID=2873325 RepID=A0A553QC71_9TELE|nr:hypothetical protein DNTS_007093 [Danionella translucida]